MSNNGNANENKPTNVFNKVNGKVPYAVIKANVNPYVKSRVWARRVREAAAGGAPVVNFRNKRPSLKMVYLALAQALGVRYTTTGRGGGLEDAPFLPGVSAIPTIQRKLWSTPAAYMPVEQIRDVMAGHWGIDNISNNIKRNALNVKNSAPPPETLVTGAISSFYHPAFTQVCHDNGEWLINGFKVQKAAIIAKASAILGRNATVLVGAGSKGTKAAEADITKISIINWPRAGSNNYNRTRIIFTVGEDKVGPGEGAGAHGKEVAQLRFIMFAIYYMWQEIHQSPFPHPWKQIPVKNITLECVFLAAGAGTVQNTMITNQAASERTGYVSPNAPANKKIVNVVPVNLDKFCAIFRLDAYRFAEAMTAVDKKFRNKMIEYFTNIKRFNNNPNTNTLVNNSSLINVSSGLATLKLNNSTLGRNFKPVILRAPRTNWAKNQNRKNWELYWFSKYNSAGKYRPSINEAMAAFGRPRGSTRNITNVASYYSGESDPNRLARNEREAAFKGNEFGRAQAAAEAEARRLEAARVARKEAMAAGENRRIRTARDTLKRAQEAVNKYAGTATKAQEKRVTELKTAKMRFANAMAMYGGAPVNTNAYIQSVANRTNFAVAYKEFLTKNIDPGLLRQKLINLAAMNETGQYNAKRRYVNAQLARAPR